MSEVTFTVPGPVQGKGRARFSRASGRAFTPARTVSYEGKIAHLASEAMKGAGPFAAGTPLACSVVAVLVPPASWSKKKQAKALDGLLRPTKKPDGDNILKVLGDALNGVVWHDDAAVVEWRLSKVYGPRDGLDVAVTPLAVERMAPMLRAAA